MCYSGPWFKDSNTGEDLNIFLLQCENESLITAAVKFGIVGFVDIFTSIYNL
jgi:hypothetical protein